ncbi:MAG: D-aminoacyl-tRNA deacylase [Ilumatobacteraceae bacterium]
MRAVVQRVTRAKVEVGGELVGEIGPGLCVLVGVTHDDDEASADKLADKIWHLRIMEDEAGVMNRSVADTTREVLIVSQFTLYGDTAGRRQEQIAAARPEHAEPLVDRVVSRLRSNEASAATGPLRARHGGRTGQRRWSPSCSRSDVAAHSDDPARGGHTVWVLGDRSTGSSAIAARLPSETGSCWSSTASSRQALASPAGHLVLAGMRRLAAELRDEGFAVDLRRADALRTASRPLHRPRPGAGHGDGAGLLGSDSAPARAGREPVPSEQFLCFSTRTSPAGPRAASASPWRTSTASVGGRPATPDGRRRAVRRAVELRPRERAAARRRWGVANR